MFTVATALSGLASFSTYSSFASVNSFGKTKLAHDQFVQTYGDYTYEVPLQHQNYYALAK